jgi:hypothetical protein
MRFGMLWICGLIAGCAGGAVTVPSEPVVMEVPYSGTASTAGGDGFTSTIESALAEGDPLAPAPVAGSTTGTGRALDDDTINLMQWTLEQQKIDAAIAERDLAEARSQLVVMQPGPLPANPQGVNIALFAAQTTNAVGERRYQRTGGTRIAGAGTCSRFRDADAAQRAFLSGGGPERDRYGIEPDGDGFACSWNPAPYRALR